MFILSREGRLWRLTLSSQLWTTVIGNITKNVFATVVIPDFLTSWQSEHSRQWFQSRHFRPHDYRIHYSRISVLMYSFNAIKRSSHNQEGNGEVVEARASFLYEDYKPVSLLVYHSTETSNRHVALSFTVDSITGNITRYIEFPSTDAVKSSVLRADNISYLKAPVVCRVTQ